MPKGPGKKQRFLHAFIPASLASPLLWHPRFSGIPASLDAGAPLRGVQGAASHAGPRTTVRYDRARVSLDRHATYIVATLHRWGQPVARLAVLGAGSPCRRPAGR